MKNKIDLTYLGDVLDAIKWIEGYLRGVEKEDFLENHMMQDAVMHQIEIIGMASNNVSDEFQERHPELPWMLMRAIRNKIAHDYREINLNIIWDTAKNDLPPLKKTGQEIIEGIGSLDASNQRAAVMPPPFDGLTSSRCPSGGLVLI